MMKGGLDNIKVWICYKHLKVVGFTMVMVCAVIIVLVLVFRQNAEGTEKKKPNIVIILGDDVGWNDVSFHGSNQIPTPNIDALAYNGVILNRFYTQSICTPSRAALLTGYYPIRAGLQGLPLVEGENTTLPVQFTLLPEKLKELGYRNHLVGKWHLGFLNSSTTPLGRGFDSHFGYWPGFMSYYKQERTSYGMTGFCLRDGKAAARKYQGHYITDIFTDKAVEIINDHNDSSPFFLFVSHLAAHSNGTITEPRNIDMAKKKFHYIQSDERKYFADVMTDFDRSVGSIVEALEYKGVLEDTIILVFMDNGAENIGYFPNGGSNWPLRGQKYTSFEGGVRGTAVLYSSKLRKRSSVNNELMHITDVFPTFYAAAGGNCHNLGKLDGVNQWEMLTKNKHSARNQLLVNIDEKNHTSAIIGFNGKWKLLNGTFNNGTLDGYFGSSGNGNETPEYNFTNILNSKTQRAFNSLYSNTLSEEKMAKIRSEVNLENCRNSSDVVIDCTQLCLFNLQEDPCETRNLKDKYPHIVKSLIKKLNMFWQELQPQIVGVVDPNSNPKNCNGSWFPWLDHHHQQYCT